MKTQELVNKFQTKELKKGIYTKAKWQSITIKKGVEYKKVSQGVVRFVKYSHIKGVVVKGQINVNEQCLMSDTIYHNSNTNNDYVQLARTNHKAKSTYYINGVEVDKETFEKQNPPRQGTPSPIFRVKIENLLEVGNN